MDMLEKKFRKIVTLGGQGPWVLLWPFALHYIPKRLHLGLYYDALVDNPFAILLFTGLLMSYSGGAVIKLLFYKPRPIPQAFSNRLQKIDASSFPSIHTTNATLVGALWAWWGHLSLVASSDYLNIISLVTLIAIICVSVALSRIALQKHYPIDVLSGVLYGMLIGAVLGLVYMYGWLYRR